MTKIIYKLLFQQTSTVFAAINAHKSRLKLVNFADRFCTTVFIQHNT